MDFSKKRLLALFSFSAAVLLLSGCSKPLAPTESPTAPKAEQNIPQSTTQAAPEAIQNAQPAAQLEPLPADDKQAIDTEITNIDKDLKSTDTAIGTDDLSDKNLGL